MEQLKNNSEIEAIELVKELNSNPLIILYKENKTTSIELINACFGQVEAIVQNRPFHMVCDLTLAKPPNAVIRNELKLRFRKVEHNLASLSIVVGSNFIIKVAAQFVFKSITNKQIKFDLYSSVQDAVAIIKKRNEA